MPGVNEVRLLVKAPVPVPSVVKVCAMVGLGVVLQQMPRAETAAPPSLVTWPPPVAVVFVMAVRAAVVTVGKVTVFGFGFGEGSAGDISFWQLNNIAATRNISSFFINRFWF